MTLNRLFLLYLFLSLILEGFADPLVGGTPVGKLEKFDGELVVKSENKHPYVVHLSLYESTPSAEAEDKQCGGVLIGPQTVLTAAHCIRDMQSNLAIDVTAGRLYMLLEEGQTAPVQKYKVHEDYVKTSVLASKNSVTRKSGLIFGWGVTENKRPSLMLRMAEQKVSTLLNYTLTSTICHGDSGGPFVSNGIVYGIASFGRRTCKPKDPSVFTNVALYEDWIKTTVKNWSPQEFKKLKFEKPNVQNGKPQTKPPKLVLTKPTKRT